MTTIRQEMMSMLDERGMFPNDAQKILDQYLASEAGGSMKGRMDDNVEGYSKALLPSVWMGVKAEALRWIDTNRPKHWARPMFAE